MSLSLEQAKSLTIGQQFKVTKTGEIWTVTGIAPVDGPKKVKILTNNGTVDSYFDETRLHLFDLVESPESGNQTLSPEMLQHNLEGALHNTVEGATVELTAPEAEKILDAIQAEPPIEESSTEEAGEPDLPDAQSESPIEEASPEDEPRLEDKVTRRSTNRKRPK